MHDRRPRKVKKEEVLSWEMERYIGRFKAWSKDADQGDSISEVFGNYSVSPEEAKRLFEAYESGEEVMKKPIWIGAGNNIMIAGKVYVWPMARAIVSFFLEGRHENYLELYKNSGLEIV